MPYEIRLVGILVNGAEEVLGSTTAETEAAGLKWAEQTAAKVWGDPEYATVVRMRVDRFLLPPEKR